jgi:hypothetical protein
MPDGSGLYTQELSVMPLPHMIPARTRYPVSSADFEDTMDGIYHTLATTIGSIDENGNILASGTIADLNTQMNELAYDQFRNTDRDENIYGTTLFGFRSSLGSNDSTNGSIIKDGGFKVESV